MTPEEESQYTQKKVESFHKRMKEIRDEEYDFSSYKHKVKKKSLSVVLCRSEKTMMKPQKTSIRFFGDKEVRAVWDDAQSK